MAVTTLSDLKAKKAFIKALGRDYPDLSFKAGQQDLWSPRSRTVTYNLDQDLKHLQYGVLHELAHGVLGHANYTNDFELLKLEAEAWELAAKTGKKYKVRISEEHIQNCLDTYRDWLHRRSTCPACGMHVLQKDPKNYHCFNCQTDWQVSNGRFVRPYRKVE